MFFFGDPEQVAQAFLDAMLDPIYGGPGFRPMPLDEMTLIELHSHIVYLRMACNAAADVEAEKEVMDLLVGYHDEVFLYLIEHDSRYKNRILDADWMPPVDMSKPNRDRYRHMAGHPPMIEKSTLKQLNRKVTADGTPVSIKRTGEYKGQQVIVEITPSAN